MKAKKALIEAALVHDTGGNASEFIMRVYMPDNTTITKAGDADELGQWLYETMPFWNLIPVFNNEGANLLKTYSGF